VQVVQEPQTTEEEDVQAVKRAIALADGLVVLWSATAMVGS
jgi:hypothetical protein